MAGDEKKSDEGKGGGFVGGISDVAEGVEDVMDLFSGGDAEADEGGDDKAPDAGDHVKHAIDATQKSQKVIQEARKLEKAFKEGEGASALTGMVSNGLGVDGKNLGMLAKATGSKELKEAAKALETASKFAGAASQVFGGFEQLGKSINDLGSALKGGSRKVRYSFECEAVEHHWAVSSFRMTEELNRPYEIELRLSSEDGDADATELLGRDVEIQLDRGEHHRALAGIVRRVVLEEEDSDQHLVCTAYVVPALWALGRSQESQIFQEKTAPEILREVLELALSPYRREVDLDGLTSTYKKREFCVQYRESYLDFVNRLCEEEGIGYYFSVEDGKEKVVFFDANRQLQPAPTMDGNAVAFDGEARTIQGREPVTQLRVGHRLGATAYSVRDHDWTKTDPRVEVSRDGQDVRGRTHQVYDHGIGAHVTLADYSEPRYAANDADHQATIRHQLLTRDARRGMGTGMVIGFGVGSTFELTGHPTLGVDGEYVLVKVVHSSEPNEGSSGEDDYHNRFECIPKDVPWRPDRTTAKPRVFGIQTGKVSGPQGQEIWTDVHGRIKVMFPWNRSGDLDDRVSCWIRVSQIWAGSGYPGFVFIPRIGMEVIVTFVDGDPDRPLVTGCVYNGENGTPETLDANKTKSIIRTRSTPSSSGYNELSFEDKAGDEEVYLQAEKDLRELVKNNHSTTVRANQTNTVHVDQTETVHGKQTMTVHKERWKTVHQSEFTTIEQNRTEIVEGSEDVSVLANRSHFVKLNESLRVEKGTRTITVDVGKDTEVYKGGRETTVHKFDNLEVVAGANKNTRVTGQYNIRSDGHFKVIQNSSNELTIDDALFASVTGRVQIKSGKGQVHYDATPGGVLTIKAGQSIKLEADSEIVLQVKASTIRLTDSKIEIHSPTVELNGATQVDVKGGMVNLKP